MTTKTNIGIIGLGGIAQLVHLPILSKIKDVNILAVSEINKSRLNTVSEKFGILKKFTDYREMLAVPELDAVIIATPTDTHVDIITDCVKANKSILVEKPMVRSYEEAELVRNLLLNSNITFMVGMNLRYRPDAMLLKSLLNSGELGDLFFIKCSWLRKQSSDQQWFLNKSKSGGGVIIDLGIVLIDLALWLNNFIPVESVSAQSFHHHTTDVEDSAVGFIRMKNLAVMTFEVSWSLHSEVDSFSLTVYGTKGTAQLNPFKAYRKIESTEIDYTPAKILNTQSLFKKSYENELKHFIGAVKGNNPVNSTADEALLRMKLVKSLYESADKREEIKLM
ncbi:Gfo/Idh/MocA family protein [Melioribacteraceae bacterium 4301-Me]|uniref:Gfo/Idh/MocA family protein n=1 Tax=Pyranulibacter aquaticus TaxID=3163344 RepID=UPI00359568AA